MIISNKKLLAIVIVVVACLGAVQGFRLYYSIKAKSFEKELNARYTTYKTYEVKLIDSLKESDSQSSKVSVVEAKAEMNQIKKLVEDNKYLNKNKTKIWIMDAEKILTGLSSIEAGLNNKDSSLIKEGVAMMSN